MQCVQVKLELGHKACIRQKPTPDGFTHDWTVFVRGPEASNIQHFVEKVVFHLHQSFPKPKRVVKEPPYQVSESGYAGFVLPIEVHFKNREDPKKVQFEYDLFLHIEGPPVNHIRCEKLTFQNPTEDFRRKLIKAGGVGILGPDGGTVLGQQSEPFTDVFGPPLSNTKSSPDPVKKHKHLPKESSNPRSSTTTSSCSVSTSQEPFVALFGHPIKTSKSSPEAKKLKESTGKVASSKSIKNGNGSGSGSASVSHTPNSTPSVATTSKEGKSTSSKEKTKKISSDNKDKSSSKRTQSPSVHSEMKIPVKEKHKRTLSPSINKDSLQEPIKEVKKRKRSSSQSSSNAKSSHEKQSESRKPQKKENERKESSVKVSSEKQAKESKADGENSRNSEDSDVKASKKGKHQADKNKSSKETSVVEKVKNDSKVTPLSSPEDSPNSSISFSSLHISGKQGPLGTLMAELDDQDDDEDLVSPLSSDPPSPPRFTQKDEPPKSSEPALPEEVKEKHSAKPFPLSKSSSLEEATDTNAGKSSPLQMDLSYLTSLQRQITLIQDRDNLQKIVDILEETGLYTINSETLDFDLCALDKETLKKIKNCIVPVCS